MWYSHDREDTESDNTRHVTNSAFFTCYLLLLIMWPMAFPICQGRPPGLEERWMIRRPDKIKKKTLLLTVITGFRLQVVDVWLGNNFSVNGFYTAPCSSDVTSKRIISVRSRRATSKNSVDVSTRRPGVWFLIFLALKLEASATTAAILRRGRASQKCLPSSVREEMQL